MLLYYGLELISKPGHFVCGKRTMVTPTPGILSFKTEEDAEAYRWQQDALMVMGTRVSAHLIAGSM
jgi:hypothetical protein